MKEKEFVCLDDLKTKLDDLLSQPNYQHCGEDWKNGICMAKGVVEETKTINAVEVVKCKDCKHRADPESCPMRYFETDSYCDVDGYTTNYYTDHDYTNDDGFCDRGERK